MYDPDVGAIVGGEPEPVGFATEEVMEDAELSSGDEDELPWLNGVAAADTDDEVTEPLDPEAKAPDDPDDDAGLMKTEAAPDAEEDAGLVRVGDALLPVLS